MNAIWSVLSNLFFKLLIPFGAFYAGRNAEKNDQLREDVKNAEADSKAWKNRPRTDSDVLKRLRDAAKNKSP